MQGWVCQHDCHSGRVIDWLGVDWVNVVNDLHFINKKTPKRPAYAECGENV